MAFCSQCGNDNPDAAVFCSKCGTRLEATNRTAEANTGQDSQPLATNASPASQNQPHPDSTYPGSSAYPGQYSPVSSPYPGQSTPGYSAAGASSPGYPYPGGYPYQMPPAGGYAAPAANAVTSSNKKNRGLIIALASALAIVLVLTIGGWFYYSNYVSQLSGTTADYDALRTELMENHANYDLEIVSTDVSQYPTVRLYLSLTDSDQQELTLKSPTGAIKEKIAGGSEIKREIKKIERIKDNQGVGFEVLLDKSASMSEDLGEMQNAMRNFVNTLDYKVGDKAELMAFDTYLMYMSTLTGEKNRLLTGISNITADGDTALYDALYEGVANAGNRTGSNCVIAFTDGIENSSSHTLDEVISLATEKAVPIYLIGSSESDLDTLQQIADETKGYLWDISSISDMGEVLEKINSRQKNLYTIEYTSDAKADPYAERTISALIGDADDFKVGAIKDGVAFTPVKRSGIEKHKSRYEAFKEDKTWSEANNTCMAKGGHLVTITSQQEEQQVISLVESKGIEFAWMGGYTSERDNGVFAHWVTGEEWSYQNWFPGEPSHTDLDGAPEFYLLLWKIRGQWSWNDERDNMFAAPDAGDRISGKAGYVCEYEQ